jgi:hypothetical protein
MLHVDATEAWNRLALMLSRDVVARGFKASHRRESCKKLGLVIECTNSRQNAAIYHSSSELSPPWLLSSPFGSSLHFGLQKMYP